VLLFTLTLMAPPELAPPPRPAPTPGERLAAAAKALDDLDARFSRDLRAAGEDMHAVSAANRDYNRDRKLAAEHAAALVRAHPAEQAALDALVAVARRSRLSGDLLAVLRTHHFASPKVGGLVFSFAQGTAEQRAFADAVAADHPDRAVRGKAAFDIGRLSKRYLLDAAEPKPSFGGRLGPPDQLRSRAEECLTRVAEQYADLPYGGGTLGRAAAGELAGLRNIGRLEVGQTAPELTGEDVGGRPLRLSDTRGKVTVLVFWGSWCGPCMALVPREKALAEKYAGATFALVGVNGGDDRAKAAKAAADKGMTWPSFFNGPQDEAGIAAAWNVTAWPTVVVLDPAGVIRHRSHGDGLEEAVEAAVRTADRHPAR
jgi:thiol-disulfide isomerase/thioredoxin